MPSAAPILIVNFDFPPNYGIGGRRWAKFAKQLAHEGYHVHVIKADPVPGTADSVWTEDVRHPRISINSLPRTYPDILSHPLPGLANKIKYHLAKWKMSKIEAGTIYDISIGWDKDFLPLAQKLIHKEGIVNVIATGAPWNLLTYAAQLKEAFPDLNLIIDYRDPWMNARNYGMPGLDAQRRKVEERKQQFILSKADVVTTPYEYLTSELRNFSRRNKAHFAVLPHFYDPDDIPANVTVGDEKLVIVYGGELYFETKSRLRILKDQLIYLKRYRPELYAKLDVRFFTDTPDMEMFSGLSAVKMNPSIGKRIFAEWQRASLILIIMPTSKRNDRTTKFFEVLPFRKPMLLLAEEGEVTSFVRTNKLGFTVGKEEDSLCKILEDLAAGKNDFNDSFDYSQFSLPVVTQQLISYFR